MLDTCFEIADAASMCLVILLYKGNTKSCRQKCQENGQEESSDTQKDVLFTEWLIMS